LNHRASPEFWKCYEKLPPQIRDLADKNFSLLKKDPQHPSLHFKRIDRFYSVRVGISYRALGMTTTDGVVWFWIGNHSEYDKLLG
jgi:hypothetical protein